MPSFYGKDEQAVASWIGTSFLPRRLWNRCRRKENEVRGKKKDLKIRMTKGDQFHREKQVEWRSSS